MISEEVIFKLKICGQNHLLDHFKRLASSQRARLERAIAALDAAQVLKERADIFLLERPQMDYAPLVDVAIKGSDTDRKLGNSLLSEGKCALLLVAGGQGTRLGFDGPKGCFPLSAVKKKTLYQLFAEKIQAANRQVGRSLEVAIMTSPLNHAETQLYFVQNAFFGLPPDKIHFFVQEMWPLLDLEGKLFLESPDKIAFGPNGNAAALRGLVSSGICERWKSIGIEYISYVHIDNALADPFDAEFFGFHARSQSEISAKTVKRSHPKENVGVFAHSEGKAKVIEYTELPLEERSALNQEGDLKYLFANISTFCFSLSFIEREAMALLPLHRARKKHKWIDLDGPQHLPQQPNVWKFEEFIFDFLPLSERVNVILYPREECFAPLKNKEGEDSIATVQDALRAADMRAFYRVAGKRPPLEEKKRFVEVDQAFYYPTEELATKWRGKEMPNQSYIEGL